MSNDRKPEENVCGNCSGGIISVKVAVPTNPDMSDQLSAICETCYQQDKKRILNSRRNRVPLVAETCEFCNVSTQSRFVREYGMHVCDSCCEDNDRLEEDALLRQNLDESFFIMPNEIIQGQLFLGSKLSSISDTQLLSKNIRRIIVCCGHLPGHFIDAMHESDDFSCLSMVCSSSPVDRYKFQYLRIPVADSLDENITPYLQAAIDFIEEGVLKYNCATLVHCHGGISRSASIAIAYIMKTQCMSYDSAFQLVKSQRRAIRPNSSFEEQLRAWGVS
ncbi:dual specificity protein phosphatase family protein [archaeon]|nr:MAG: dual specificity protein phosphatase family protein [archaeon]